MKVIKLHFIQEMFHKWNETLQTCVTELDLASVIHFDAGQDLENFNQDTAELIRNLKVILELAINSFGSVDAGLEASEKLLQQQQADRTQYHTQKAVKAEKIFDLKAIKYEKIIGQGGISQLLLQDLE